jgi:mono/diheme cytochrome c family protein
VLLALAAASGDAAHSYSSGITGRTNKDGGAGCGTCHSPDSTLVVSISGPTTLAAGETGNYQVNISGGAASTKAGVNIAASTNNLSESSSFLQKPDDDLTHTLTDLNTNGSGVATFSFSYTMPASSAVGTTRTLYAAARVGTKWKHASNFTITVPKLNQTITFGAQTSPRAFSLSTFSISPLATASSGLAVSYSSDTTSVCTVSGTTVTPVAVGTCTIRANQDGNATYNAAPDVTRSIVIEKGNQTITFGTQLVTPTYAPSGTFTLDPAASASSGLPISYSSTTTSICTKASSGTTVGIVATGTCSITAAQPGNSNWNAATSVSRTITIAKAAQTITFPAQSSETFVDNSTFSINPVATASSGLAVTYTSTTPAICSTPGTTSTTVTMLDPGTCTIQASQAGNGNYFAAASVSQNIVFNDLPGQPTMGTRTPGDGRAFIAFTPPANASNVLYYTATCSQVGQPTRTGTNDRSPILVTGLTNGIGYSCTVTGTNVSGTGPASAVGAVTPSSALVAPSILSFNTATFRVGEADSFLVMASGTPAPSITRGGVALPSGISFPNGVSIAGTGSLGGTAAAGTVGSYAINFTASNSQGSSMIQSFTLVIAKGNPVITFGALLDRTYSPTPFALSASLATPDSTLSSGFIVFTSATPATCSVSGVNVTMLATGTCTINANTTTSNTSYTNSYNAAAQVQRSFVISKASQTIGAAFATPTIPTRSFFNGLAYTLSPLASASSGLPVSYASLTPGVCSISGTTVSVLAVGVCTIEASQDGNALYLPAVDVLQSTTITKGLQVISWGAQSNQTFGTGGTFPISPLATGGGSGNPIVYGSTTPAVCTVSGSTVTKVAAGTCTLTANQAGNDNFVAASQVSRSLTIAASVPTAPSINGAVVSDAQALVAFDAPSSDGGSPITAYVATCTPTMGAVVQATGSASPILVAGLTNGITYDCVVRAQNGAGTGPASSPFSLSPILRSGEALWNRVCSGCHGSTPSGTRFNAAGQSSEVLEYVRRFQATMQAEPTVQALTLNELAEIAKYIETFVPVIAQSTAFNTPTTIDVGSHLTLGTVSFEEAVVYEPPASGDLKSLSNVPNQFTGTQIVFTPAAGFVGNVTFTYRGYRANPNVLKGEPRTVTVTVAPPPAPVITSAAMFAATVGQAASYQITATNSPTSYNATSQGNCGGTPISGNFSINSMTGLISGTPANAGAATIKVCATNAGGTGSLDVEVTVSKANQSITFGAQGGQTYMPSGTFGLSPTASASSGLAVTYSSLTPSVCSIAGTTVTMLAAGTCTIAADQAGNANYNAALQVTQGISIAATVPGAPTIGAATPGDTQAAIAFTPPANNGGSPISSYSARCNPGNIMASGSASPITVTGLANGTTYTCDVRATNAVGNSAFSGAVMVTPQDTPVPPNITSANAAAFTVLSGGSFNVTATGTPAPTLAQSGSLPAGVSFVAATGVLSGTPASGMAGTYPLTFTATNNSGSVMQSFTLTVQKANQTIAFTGPASQAFSTAPITLSASATSGLTVTFASNTPSVCTVSGTTLTLVTVGTCSVTASQAGNADYNAANNVTQGFSVTQAAQTISFPAQSPAARDFLAGSTFPVNPTASASSGLPILYSSTTTSVCTVVGTMVTMVAPGTCTLAANQAGNANYGAAAQVTRSVTLNATVPGAPTIGTASPGNAQATVNFAAPANNGGAPILDYTVTCAPGGVTATGSASPIVVSGLTNGTLYSCSVRARNSVGSGAASGIVTVTPLSGLGSVTWANVCNDCHAATPSGNQLNGAGATATVLQFVRTHQPLMAGYSEVSALTASDLQDLAIYIASVLPPIEPTVVQDQSVTVNVDSHISFTAQAWSSFDAVEVVTPPANGTLKSLTNVPNAFTGTQIVYTPNPGFFGTDTFTYRGKLTGVHNGDPRTITLTVTQAPPVISSPNMAAGTFGSAFSYQIVASNSPTSYGASNLPGGVTLNPMSGLISGTPTQTGTFPVTLTATNGGGSGNLALTVTIAQASQSIDFPAQPSPRTYSLNGTFPISPVATGGASGNAIEYDSLTPAVCTVSGTMVSMVAAGSCTISADQAGNVNYAAAVQVTRTVEIDATVPGAPTIGVAVPGDTTASIAFSAPANDGGTPITLYTVNCGGPSQSGAGSPILLTGLTNGVTYTCTVAAANAVGSGPASGTVMVTPQDTPVPPQFTSSSSTAFTVLTAGSFSVTASGTPEPALSLHAGSLPNGLSFEPSTGTLSGTPASGTAAASPYLLTFRASGSTSVDQAFTLTVNKRAQTISFPNPGTQAFSLATMALSASATSALTVSFSSNTPGVCTVSGNQLTTVSVGSCTIVASQSGDADYLAASAVSQTFTIAQASQTITFGVQASPRLVTGGAFAIDPLASASSNLAVTYSSLTTGVCTVSGTTVTPQATGTCTIAANQAGNANFAAAAQVTRSVTINASVPGAPTIGAATAGNTEARIAFTAPASNGGSPITGYTATCNPGNVSGSGAASPVLVSGLTNGTAYTCAVTAQNAAGSSASSGSVTVTPNPQTGAGQTLWTSVCAACHTAVPSGSQLNAAGSTATVLSYVRANQTLMQSASNVQSLSNGEMAEIALYIRDQLTALSGSVVSGNALTLDVASHITLTNQAWSSFDVVEVVSAPANGSLKSLTNVNNAFTGTQIVYTPNPGFSGADTFTYRGKRTGVHNGDVRTITITVLPPPPVITSSNMASGSFGAAFTYTITASNSPTSFAASGLPAGLLLNNTTGAITGTPGATGSFPVTLSATNAGGTGVASLTITIAQAAQVISFPAQTSPRTYGLNGTFAISPLATGGASGNAIVYGSAATAVCTVSGTTVSMLSAGTCILTADQAGNANYAAAATATQNVVIDATVPGAPTLGVAVPGDTTASISFTAPASNGGSPILSYAVNCGGPSASGTASPIQVTGLTNGVTYSCTVAAINAVGSSATMGSVMVTPQATPVPPQFTSVNNTAFTVLSAGTFTVTASGTPAPTLALVAGTLPAGVTFTAATGALAGTPASGTAAASPYALTFRASGSGTVDQTFTLTVNKANQSIAFTNPGDRAFSPSPFALAVSASSGLAVSVVSATPSVCSVSASQVTLLSVGTCTLNANQAGNADYNAAAQVQRSFTVTAASQTISFGAQTSPRDFAAGSFAISPLATASSGLAVTYSSTTPAVCTVSGTTVAMVAPGTCTLAANQAGNANYVAAAQVTQSVTINATVPGVPTNVAAAPGNGQATITFSAPAFNGGSTISGYTATCMPGSFMAAASASPIVVGGLTNNTTYSCTVAAQNGIGTGNASTPVSVTPVSGNGAALWQSVCTGCHGPAPSGNQFNGAGSSGTVLDYVRTNQTIMKLISGVMNLTAGELADVASYIAANVPAINVATPMDTPASISVGSHITLTGQAWSAFDAVEVVTPPAHGSLGMFSGTQVTYTPSGGYQGGDSFTYRGKRNGVHVGDPRTVAITVTPQPPSITGMLTANGTFGSAFSYQITASNAPTSFGASGLPAGLSVDTMTGLISGTPTAAGTSMVTISAANAGGTGMATLTINVAQAAQSINFLVQTPASRPFVPGGTFAIVPTATGGASGNPIVYGSTTPAVCTVSGNTVTMVAAGTCTISANQAGDANYAAAPQVTQNVNINAVEPGAATVGMVTAGNGQATVNFTAPSQTGGVPILSYTVVCGALTASGATSPITITGLTNGATVTCFVRTTNSAMLSADSATFMVTPVALQFENRVFSRKAHGAIIGDLTIDHAIPAGGNVSVEPRLGPGPHTIYFEFSSAVTDPGSVTVTDVTTGLPISGPTAAASGKFVVVSLTGAPEIARLTIALTGVNGAVSAAASLGLLPGDVNNSRLASAADIAGIKARSGQMVDAGNFRFDLNASGGTISSADITTAKVRAGQRLP